MSNYDFVRNAVFKAVGNTNRWQGITKSENGPWHCGNGWNHTDNDLLAKELGNKFDIKNTNGYMNISLKPTFAIGNIKLTELLHSVSDSKNEELIPIDDWRYPDVDHLVSMGFEFADDHHLSLDADEKITVYKKKADKNESSDSKNDDIFIVEEPKRGIKRFETFNDVIEYFDNYHQPELEKNK